MGLPRGTDISPALRVSVCTRAQHRNGTQFRAHGALLRSRRSEKDHRGESSLFHSRSQGYVHSRRVWITRSRNRSACRRVKHTRIFLNLRSERSRELNRTSRLCSLRNCGGAMPRIDWFFFLQFLEICRWWKWTGRFLSYGALFMVGFTENFETR